MRIFDIGRPVRIADVNSVDADMVGRRGTIEDVDRFGRYWLNIGADAIAGPFDREELESATMSNTSCTWPSGAHKFVRGACTRCGEARVASCSE